jgi:hypothetical protein
VHYVGPENSFYVGNYCYLKIVFYTNRYLDVGIVFYPFGYRNNFDVVGYVLYAVAHQNLDCTYFRLGFVNENMCYSYLCPASNYYPYSVAAGRVAGNVYDLRNVSVYDHRKVTDVGYRPQ